MTPMVTIQLGRKLFEALTLTQGRSALQYQKLLARVSLATFLNICKINIQLYLLLKERSFIARPIDARYRNAKNKCLDMKSNMFISHSRSNSTRRVYEENKIRKDTGIARTNATSQNSG